MNKPLFALGACLLLLGIGMLYGVSVVAHPGGTSDQGCHRDRSTGNYHCHAGPYDGMSFQSAEQALAFMSAEPDWPTMKVDYQTDRLMQASVDKGGFRCVAAFAVDIETGLGNLLAVTGCRPKTGQEIFAQGIRQFKAKPVGPGSVHDLFKPNAAQP